MILFTSLNQGGAAVTNTVHSLTAYCAICVSILKRRGKWGEENGKLSFSDITGGKSFHCFRQVETTNVAAEFPHFQNTENQFLLTGAKNKTAKEKTGEIYSKFQWPARTCSFSFLPLPLLSLSLPPLCLPLSVCFKEIYCHHMEQQYSTYSFSHTKFPLQQHKIAIVRADKKNSMTSLTMQCV